MPRKRNKRTFADYSNCKCHPKANWHRFGENLKCTGCGIDYYSQLEKPTTCLTPDLSGKTPEQIERLTHTYRESLLEKSTHAQ